MISGSQIRAARAFLRWSIKDLAERSAVSWPAIQRIEQDDNVPNAKAHTLLGIQKAFEAAGIEFIGTPDEGPGVRLKKPQKS